MADSLNDVEALEHLVAEYERLGIAQSQPRLWLDLVAALEAARP